MPWIKADLTAYTIIDRVWRAGPNHACDPNDALLRIDGFPCDCGGYAMTAGDFAACMKCKQTYEWMPETDGKAE